MVLVIGLDICNFLFYDCIKRSYMATLFYFTILQAVARQSSPRGQPWAAPAAQAAECGPWLPAIRGQLFAKV